MPQAHAFDHRLSSPWMGCRGWERVQQILKCLWAWKRCQEYFNALKDMRPGHLWVSQVLFGVSVSFWGFASSYTRKKTTTTNKTKTKPSLRFSQMQFGSGCLELNVSCLCEDGWLPHTVVTTLWSEIHPVPAIRPSAALWAMLAWHGSSTQAAPAPYPPLQLLAHL